MGKNQAYKAMQRSRVGSTSGGLDEIEDGMVDGSFHSPEWHAARLASLKTSHTVTWEEFKKKQKEDEMKKGEAEADKDRMMRDYRAQLDAERAVKLAYGRNHSSSKSSHKKDKKDRDSRKRSSKKRKEELAVFNTLFGYFQSHSRRRSSESSFSSSSSDLSRSDDEDRESRRSKSRSKRTKKEKKHGSKSKHSISNEETDGPVPLSRFFGNAKS